MSFAKVIASSEAVTAGEHAELESVVMYDK